MSAIICMSDIEGLPCDPGILLAAKIGRECCWQDLGQFSYDTKEKLQQTS